jgi:hypothetical protein
MGQDHTLQIPNYNFFVPQQPYLEMSCLTVEVSRSHTVRHTTLCRTSLQEGSARRRDMYQTNTTFPRDRHPCIRRESKPQFQPVSVRRPTPWSARPQGPGRYPPTYSLQSFSTLTRRHTTSTPAPRTSPY